MSLSVGIGKFRGKFKGRMGTFKRGVLLKLFGAVIQSTPVGNEDNWRITEAQRKAIKARGYMGGSLRGAWRFSVGAPDTTPTSGTTDPTATVTAAVTASVDETDGRYFLTNPLPYAHRVEYEGWSGQAPAGMVRPNMIRIAALLREEAAKL